MKRKIGVFIASPGDLVEERKMFRKAINQLNVGFGNSANVEYVPLGWEDTLSSTGRRTQSLINKVIDRCDVFILVMYRRWGQHAPDAEPYTSYTEEEFHRALERWKRSGAPEIFIFFKRVDAESEGDPGPELRKVMDFRKHLEETRQVLYRHFDTIQTFMDEVDIHLIAYAKNELPKADRQLDMVVLPMAALQEVEKAKKIALQKSREAKKANDAAEEARLLLEATQLQIAEDAAQLSKEGKIEFAREKLTRLVTDTMDIKILYLGYEFFSRTGDLDSALKVLEKWLSLCGADSKSVENAAVLGNLGNLYKTRGEFNHAEEMYQKSLAIYELLDRKEGVTKTYDNLGNLYMVRGEIDCAEEMHQKALAINETLDCKEGMASAYAFLGNLYRVRGKTDLAEEMCQKSLAINEALECKEGMASNYSNLGNLFQSRGKIDRAEEMHQKALSIEEALGHKEGMANAYGNLGNLYLIREEFALSEEMHQKALSIEEALGHKKGMASQYGNLGVLYLGREDHNMAEEMFQKALAIDEALGHKEGTASHYGNLGILYQARGDYEIAEKMYKKSLVLFREIKSPSEELLEELLRKLKNEKP